MVVRKLVARVQRLQLLSRYYVNKWHYDGSKWAERVWYGERKNAAASIASVPFMITRTMRAQLEHAGFPAQEIASLVPQVAHQLLADKVTYAQYVERKQEEIAALAAQAAEAIAREEGQQAKPAATETAASMPEHELLIVDDAASAQNESVVDASACTEPQPRVTSVLAVVPQPQQDDDKRENN